LSIVRWWSLAAAAPPSSRRWRWHTPRKSNWALRIDEPPFQAFPVTGGITFTFGGIEINGNAQVLNASDRSIRGLFASGDIIGLFFHNYPSCTGQTRNVVFSRLAGRNAAAQGL
jgi:tricarballylate dehydrogenase